jgi:hypothetical protein
LRHPQSVPEKAPERLWVIGSGSGHGGDPVSPRELVEPWLHWLLRSLGPTPRYCYFTRQHYRRPIKAHVYISRSSTRAAPMELCAVSSTVAHHCLQHLALQGGGSLIGPCAMPSSVPGCSLMTMAHRQNQRRVLLASALSPPLQPSCWIVGLAAAAAAATAEASIASHR